MACERESADVESALAISETPAPPSFAMSPTFAASSRVCPSSVPDWEISDCDESMSWEYIPNTDAAPVICPAMLSTWSASVPTAPERSASWEYFESDETMESATSESVSKNTWFTWFDT